jgi:perosamine synthetase
VIPYGRQSIDDDDIAAVVRVLKGDWLTQGPHIEEFEAALAGVTGARHVVAFANGTAALHAAAAAAGLGEGDRVATSALTFSASAACALYVGARPTFLDIEADTLNLDPALVSPEHDALVAVHYAGLPLDLARLAHRPRVIIEDASHALGALTPDGPVGNCARSDLCTFSFHPVKTVTSGEGGAVSTNSAELAERLRSFRSHGMARRPDRGAWYYEIENLGYNYRLTDIQAALGTSQLSRLKRFVERRNALAERYRVLLGGLPLLLPPGAAAGCRHAYHLFAVQVDRRQQVFDELRAAGIGVQVHYVPLHRHPLYANYSTGPGGFPVTEKVYAGLLSLPMYPDLSEAQQDRVVEVLGDVLWS